MTERTFPSCRLGRSCTRCSAAQLFDPRSITCPSSVRNNSNLWVGFGHSCLGIQQSLNKPQHPKPTGPDTFQFRCVPDRSVVQLPIVF